MLLSIASLACCGTPPPRSSAPPWEAMRPHSREGRGTSHSPATPLRSPESLARGRAGAEDDRDWGAWHDWEAATPSASMYSPMVMSPAVAGDGQQSLDQIIDHLHEPPQPAASAAEPRVRHRESTAGDRTPSSHGLRPAAVGRSATPTLTPKTPISWTRTSSAPASRPAPASYSHGRYAHVTPPVTSVTSRLRAQPRESSDLEMMSASCDGGSSACGGKRG